MTRKNIFSQVGSLFSEARRRRVIRSGAIYLGFAWVAIEVSTTVFPVLGLPDWGVKAIVVLLIALFPVALLVSWTFDIGPRGFERTLPAVTEQPALAGQAWGEDRTAPLNSIAVLPFNNRNRHPDHEYLGDGIAEELLDRLADISGLTVAARTSSFAFKGLDTDAREIGRRLGVRHLLAGSVRQSHNRLRIAAELIDARSGHDQWSQVFDRPLDDIFAVQDDIADAIVAVLRDTLGDESEDDTGAGTPPTSSIEAYQSYLRGRYLWQKRGEMALRGASGALAHAIDLDPGFAQAYALQAAVHAVLHEYCEESREEGFALAEPLAHKAISLDRTLGMPHAVLGYIGLRLWRWEAAEAALLNALALDDNDPLLHQWYSNLLNDLGRSEEALAAAGRAWQIDRLSPMANNILALNHLLHGNDEQALRHTSVAREFGIGGIVPAYVGYFVHLRRKEYENAIKAWEGAQANAGLDGSWVRIVVSAIAGTTSVEQALTALRDAQAANAISPAALIVQYILLGEADLVFDLAETKLADHSFTHAWLLLPESESLRQHPRFLPLMGKMGLLDYWEHHGWPERLKYLRPPAA